MTTLSKKSSPNYIFEDVGNRGDTEQDKTVIGSTNNNTDRFTEEQFKSHGEEEPL